MAVKTHSSIIKDIAQSTGRSQADVTEIVDAFLSGLSENLREGHTIGIRDFGSFRVVTRKQTNRYSPAHGTSVTIPEREVVTFKPATRVLQYNQLYKK